MQSLSAVIAFASAAFYLAVPSNAAAPDAAQTGLLLEQESSLLGPLSVIISGSGIKISAKRSGLVIVSKGPDWNVSEFNLRTKKIFTTPFKNYAAAKGNGTQSIFTAFHGFTLSDIPLDKLASANLFNLPVQNFKASKDFQVRMEQRRKSEKVNGSSPENVQYQILSFSDYADQACNILARTTGCAELNRLPVTLIYTGTDKKQYRWLVTASIHKVQVKDRDFALPQDCVTVKNESLLNQTDDTADGVMNLFDMGHR